MARYCVPALLEKARSRTGTSTSTARGSAFPDFTFSENVTSACEIHGLPKCVLYKCTAISDAADSLTVGYVKRVLCGHFHLIPLIILS